MTRESHDLAVYTAITGFADPAALREMSHEDRAARVRELVEAEPAAARDMRIVELLAAFATPGATPQRKVGALARLFFGREPDDDAADPD